MRGHCVQPRAVCRGECEIASPTPCAYCSPIDYVIWGNHEADLEHVEACARTREYKGVWINTNMQDYETFEETQVPYAVVDVTAPGTSHSRTVGLLGILTNSSNL